MTTPLRIEPRLAAVSVEHKRWPRSRPVLVLIGCVAACLVAMGVLAAVQCSTRDHQPLPRFETACFGAGPVCLTNDPRLPWLAYYKQHAPLLGSVLWRGDVFGRLGCVAFTHYLICPSDDPRVRGSLWQFEPVDLGIRLLPPGLTPNVEATLHPLAAAYAERLRQERQEQQYWLGTPIADAICTSSTTGGADAGTCEQWYSHAVLKWPNRASATVADIYLLDLGRRLRP